MTSVLPYFEQAVGCIERAPVTGDDRIEYAKSALVQYIISIGEVVMKIEMEP